MTHTCRITKEVEFDAGHRVPSHTSKCRNPHGHRYRVQAMCEGLIVNDPGAPDDGMLVDFGDLKSLLRQWVHDPLDHSFICHQDDPLLGVLRQASSDHGHGAPWNVVAFPFVPTAENLARWCWQRLEPVVAERFRDGLALIQVAVWETPTSVAYYTGPGSPANEARRQLHASAWPPPVRIGGSGTVGSAADVVRGERERGGRHE